jgi:integrase
MYSSGIVRALWIQLEADVVGDDDRHHVGGRGFAELCQKLRHSFVSLLSDGGMPIEQISLLVGHSGTTVTELVYRKQIRPVIQNGATVMDELFRERGA